jgi:hypothetical protein
MERESKLLKVNNGREREGVATSPRKKKRPFSKRGTILPLHQSDAYDFLY